MNNGGTITDMLERTLDLIGESDDNVTNSIRSFSSLNKNTIRPIGSSNNTGNAASAASMLLEQRRKHKRNLQEDVYIPFESAKKTSNDPLIFSQIANSTVGDPKYWSGAANETAQPRKSNILGFSSASTISQSKGKSGSNTKSNHFKSSKSIKHSAKGEAYNDKLNRKLSKKNQKNGQIALSRSSY